MDTITLAACIQAFAAVATFGAACLAAFVTWKAPQRAAVLAERLRIQNEEARAIRAERMRIFRIMMDHRGANISAVEPVNALNMIAVAFHDDREVLTSYERFLSYANGEQFKSHRADAYIDILSAMVKSLGLASSVSRDEINRGYFPLS